MPIGMSVRKEFKQAKRFLSEAERRAVPRATSGAINQTATRVRKQGIPEMVQQGGYPNKRMVKPHWFIQRARTRNLTAIIGVRRSKAPNLIRFNARQTAAGVAHTAWEGGTARGAFIANQGRTVFRRVGKQRLPIEPLWGPMPANEFTRDPLPGKLVRIARKVFPDLFNEQMRKQLAKARRRRR